ncbi:hypothetical protein RsoM2USA_420 [Ralstonia phage RsoM2USA]|nr:hypothetical protein RsoM2USA_420 [Ralstonia phage RsoM2USA]
MASNANELLGAKALAEQIILVAGVQAKAQTIAQQVLMRPSSQAKAWAIAEQVLLQPGSGQTYPVATWWFS